MGTVGVMIMKMISLLTPDALFGNALEVEVFTSFDNG